MCWIVFCLHSQLLNFPSQESQNGDGVAKTFAYLGRMKAISRVSNRQGGVTWQTENIFYIFTHKQA